MKLILIGPPGSGKSTMAEHIARKYRIANIEIKAVDRTNPDIIGDLDRSLKSDAVKNGFVFDDFPVTVREAEALFRVFVPDRVIYYDLGEFDSYSRIMGRRRHKDTGVIYHVFYNKPEEDKSDKSNDEKKKDDRLEMIEGDDIENIKRRINESKYYLPDVKKFYESKGILTVLKSENNPALMLEKTEEVIKSLVDKS